MNQTICLIGVNRFFGIEAIDHLLQKNYTLITVLTNTDPSLDEQLSTFQMKYPEKLHIFSLSSTEEEVIIELIRKIKQTGVNLDFLILNVNHVPVNSKHTILDCMEYDELLETYEWNVTIPLAITARLLPQMKNSSRKRICYVTTEASSVNMTKETDNYGYAISKAALNMQANLIFNKYIKEGFTFRVYCSDPDTPNNEITGCEYFLMNRSYEAHAPKHSDELRLVMRNATGTELPW